MHQCNRREFLATSTALALGARAPESSSGLVIGQPEGAKVGLDVLARGGNAVDAAVAAGLVAGVVALRSCGIGGYGGHMVIADPSREVRAIDFNSTAPRATRPDLFPLDERGAVKGRVDTFGWLAAGVPGTLDGLHLALTRYGTRSLAQLLEPAIRLANDGFALTRADAEAIKTAAPRFKVDPGSAKLFFRGGTPLAAGERFRNPDLGRMLEELAKANSVRPFYEGRIADQIAAAFRAANGLVTRDDLAAYHAHEVAPLTMEWQGRTIATAPLTAGGLSVLQALKTLHSLGWSTWDAKDVKTTHARVEALRLAWHDRLTLLGDSARASVPVDKLLSTAYAEESARRIRQALKEGRLIPGKSTARPDGGTIHLSSVDAKGMMVALTLTHGGSFGAQVTVDGLGLILGHGMSRFDPRPDHPNSPGPGKRPLHNMCPTIVLEGGRPVVALGATGGRRIPNTLFDVLCHLVGEGRSLEDSVKAPRMHTEGATTLALERTWPETDRKYLQSAGYEVTVGGGASLNAIARDRSTGQLTSAAR